MSNSKRMVSCTTRALEMCWCWKLWARRLTLSLQTAKKDQCFHDLMNILFVAPGTWSWILCLNLSVSCWFCESRFGKFVGWEDRRIKSHARRMNFSDFNTWPHSNECMSSYLSLNTYSFIYVHITYTSILVHIEVPEGMRFWFVKRVGKDYFGL